MRIKNFQAENFKKLVVVEIEPDGNLVQITGENGNGKTSVLDAIWVALAGLSVSPEKPIRDGQTQARIRIDMGEIVVTRTFKEKEGGYTSSIRVENADGTALASPQALLDGLMGHLTFDPMAFSRLDSKGKFEALRRFVPDVDFDMIDAENKADYAARTDLNRKAKEADTLARNITFERGLPADRIDESALTDELQKAAEFNANIEMRKNNRANMVKTNAERQKELDRLAQEITRLQNQFHELTAAIDADQKKLASAPPLPEPVDVSKAREKLDEAKRVNGQIALREEQAEHKLIAEEIEKQAAVLTEKMKKRDEDKKAKIAAAKLPVEGIGFGEGSVLLNDQPFSQASDAEQLRASIAIAMGLNPKLRIIRVRDGSLLDKKSMAILAEMADKQDYQVWIERVDDSGKVGFVLEDGYLKSHLIEGDE